MNRVYNNFISQTEAGSELDEAALKKSILDDLTINEHFRLLRVIHGRINLDPLYTGLSQYFANVIQCQNSYLPSSMAQAPFHQEIFVLTWRLMTTNDVSLSNFHLNLLSLGRLQ